MVAGAAVMRRKRGIACAGSAAPGCITGVPDAVDESDVAQPLFSHQVAAVDPHVPRRKHIVQQLGFGGLGIGAAVKGMDGADLGGLQAGLADADPPHQPWASSSGRSRSASNATLASGKGVNAAVRGNPKALIKTGLPSL